MLRRFLSQLLPLAIALAIFALVSCSDDQVVRPIDDQPLVSDQLPGDDQPPGDDPPPAQYDILGRLLEIEMRYLPPDLCIFVWDTLSVSGAMVFLDEDSTITDAEGYFTFENVEEGEHTLGHSAPLYEPLKQIIELTEDLKAEYFRQPRMRKYVPIAAGNSWTYRYTEHWGRADHDELEFHTRGTYRMEVLSGESNGKDLVSWSVLTVKTDTSEWGGYGPSGSETSVSQDTISLKERNGELSFGSIFFRVRPRVRRFYPLATTPNPVTFGHSWLCDGRYKLGAGIGLMHYISISQWDDYEYTLIEATRDGKVVFPNASGIDP